MRRAGRIGALVGALSGVAILNVALLPGYTWLYDMVIVPDTPLSGRTLGTDGSVPRAVPNDAVVAVLEKVFPGDLVQAALLMVVFVVVGAGCARLTRSRAGAIAASLAACWNPYVVERLVIGHWAFLLGYCCLPWVHATSTRAVRGSRADWIPMLGWLALASVAGSTSAVIATVTALVSIALALEAPELVRVRVGALAVAAMALLNAVWIVPSFARPGTLAVDPTGVAAFAARADTPFGVLPSLLTLGGIWHQPSWAGSRGSAVVVAAALLVLVLILFVCARAGMARELSALGVAGLLGLLVAGATTLPGGTWMVEWVVTTVPGGGIVRDSQKFIALFAVFVAVATGRAVDQITASAGSRGGPERTRLWILAATVMIAPIVTLPDAPTTAGAQMRSVPISDDIIDAREYLDAAGPGGVAVFPWTQYRRFDWNDDRISLDPWNRLLDRYVVVNDDLPLSTQRVRGEDPTSAEIGRALSVPQADLRDVLSRRGVRWALILVDQPDADSSLTRLGARPQDRVFGDVRIVDLGAPKGAPPRSTSALPLATSAVAVIAAWGAWILGAVRQRPRRASPASGEAPDGPSGC